jgi:hypothetical protein
MKDVRYIQRSRFAGQSRVRVSSLDRKPNRMGYGGMDHFSYKNLSYIDD